MSLTRLFDRLLILLAGLTLLGYAIAVQWWINPSAVQRVDNFLKQHYIYEPDNRFIEIVQAYESGEDPTRIIQKLEALLDHLSRVQKVDQLAGLKRVIYAQLVRVHLRLGRLDEAGSIIEAWLTFDERDINARLERGRLLLINEDTREEGRYQIEALRQKFPHSLAVASGAARAYATIGRLGEAFLAIEPHLREDIHPHKPRIGAALPEILVGDLTADRRVEFESGLPLSIEVLFAPGGASVPVSARGLKSTGEGYVKPLEQEAELYFTADPTATASVTVRTIVIEPEVLTTTLRAELRPLLISQLNEQGAEHALKTLEKYLDAR